MRRGTVTSVKNGFLFAEDADGTRVFIHGSAFPPSPRFGTFRVGDELEFDDIELPTEFGLRPSARTARMLTVREETEQQHVRGRVVHLAPSYGYGFVAADDGGPNYFFHCTNCRYVSLKALAIGDPVVFNLVVGERGLQATDMGRLA